MKNDWTHLEDFRRTRDKDPRMGTSAGDLFGVFFVPCGRTLLRIIASSGDVDVRWEHVSVCACDYKGDRAPTWDEMCFVKGLFWEEEECVVQFHPPRSEYVNNHRHVLHLWKPVGVEIPMPPSIAVGLKGVTLKP